MIIDSHCHLDYEPMFSSLDSVVNRALKNDIGLMLTISTVDKSFENILKIINKYKVVFGTYGIHPHEAKSHENIDTSIILDKLKKNKKIIGIGETGLDFFYNHSEKNSQIELFAKHIEASHQSGLPLIIHTRSAENETLDLLKKATKKKDLKILIHCFTGSKDFAYKLIDLGAYISASGIITFKKSNELAETFKNLPSGRILIETDSPYLSPEPLRGKPNDPSHITHTLKFLSNLRNTSFEELSELTTKNFFKLFGKVI
jgi:TatD DNase family protein